MELRAGESAVSPALRAVLVFDALDGLAAWCARARRRPARAQGGLRLSPRYADRLASGPSPGSASNVSNLDCGPGGGVTVRYDAAGVASGRAAGPSPRDGSVARTLRQPLCAFSTRAGRPRSPRLSSLTRERVRSTRELLLE